MLLLVLSGRPITIDGNSAADVIAGIVVVGTLLAFVVTCFAKHRLLHGAVGAFFPPVAVYGAVRIGKPGSPWAKRFYGERRPRKQAKAVRRFPSGRRTDRFKERFRDAVGGPTDEVYRARLAERAATRDAASEIRRRAERVAVGSADAEGPPPRPGRGDIGMPLGAGYGVRVRHPAVGTFVFFVAAPGTMAGLVPPPWPVFVVGDEQPTLRARYGASYDAYCHSVPAVLPRLRRREAKAARR